MGSDLKEEVAQQVRTQVEDLAEYWGVTVAEAAERLRAWLREVESE